MLDARTELYDNAGTFMAKTHVFPQVMLIGAAEAAMSDSDQDLPFSEPVPLGVHFDDTASWRPIVCNEADAFRRRGHDPK